MARSWWNGEDQLDIQVRERQRQRGFFTIAFVSIVIASPVDRENAYNRQDPDISAVLQRVHQSHSKENRRKSTGMGVHSNLNRERQDTIHDKEKRGYEGAERK